jgi:hypothetical protein
MRPGPAGRQSALAADELTGSQVLLCNNVAPISDVRNESPERRKMEQWLWGEPPLTFERSPAESCPVDS